MLLLGVFSMLIVILAYSVYSFFYIQSEISLIDVEAQNSVENLNSTELLEKSRNDSKFLKDINNLNSTLEEFNKKEIEYNRLMKSAVIAPIVSTSTASTTVATSTN